MIETYSLLFHTNLLHWVIQKQISKWNQIVGLQSHAATTCILLTLFDGKYECVEVKFSLKAVWRHINFCS